MTPFEELHEPPDGVYPTLDDYSEALRVLRHQGQRLPDMSAYVATRERVNLAGLGMSRSGLEARIRAEVAIATQRMAAVGSTSSYEMANISTRAAFEQCCSTSDYVVPQRLWGRRLE